MLWSSSHKNEILSSARGKRNRMKKRRNLFSYHHLVLLALAVLLAFQAIERMCGPFRVVADFYATQMGLLKHSQQGNTHAKLDNSELFWLLHILMKLGSLVKRSGIHGISENIKRKQKKLLTWIWDLFYLQHLLLSEVELWNIAELKRGKGHYRILLKESLWNWTWFPLMSGKVQQMKLTIVEDLAGRFAW